MDIKKILIIVELEDGSAHQVIASKAAKAMGLKVISGFSDNGSLVISKALEPIVLKTAQQTEREVVTICTNKNTFKGDVVECISDKYIIGPKIGDQYEVTDFCGNGIEFEGCFGCATFPMQCFKILK